MANDKKQKMETMLAHFGENRKQHAGAVVPPLYQNSLFTFENWDAIDEAFDDRANISIYSRGKNPTVHLAAVKIAKLAGGEKAKLFGSGMAAISAALFYCLNPGDHVIAVKNIYGPANNMLNVYLRKKMNIETTFVEGSDPEDFRRAITPRTKLIYLESPSSAIFSLQDIKAVTAIAREHGIRTMIDNTWATPIFQKPLAMGVDLEIHSCSKYLGGHSDIVAGVIIGSEKDLHAISVTEYELLGGIMAPFDAWLLIRSLRTLPARMKQHQESALRVAQFLNEHPCVTTVNYPGLSDFPQNALARRQMTGFSGLLSFTLATENLDQIKRFFNRLDVFEIGVSWGGHESLVYAPAISYLKELPEARFKELGISVADMRLSIGLENPDDLIHDLGCAFEEVTSL